MDDAAVQPDDILPPRHEGSPPRILDVLLQFGAERAVVEETGEAVVDLGRGEDDSATLAERHDLVHLELGVGGGVGNDVGWGWLFGFGLLGGGLQ